MLVIPELGERRPEISGACWSASEGAPGSVKDSISRINHNENVLYEKIYFQYKTKQNEKTEKQKGGK